MNEVKPRRTKKRLEPVRSENSDSEVLRNSKKLRLDYDRHMTMTGLNSGQTNQLMQFCNRFYFGYYTNFHEKEQGFVVYDDKKDVPRTIKIM